jgi:hypothetical protein
MTAVEVLNPRCTPGVREPFTGTVEGSQTLE